MKKLVVICLSQIVCGLAFAQADPEPMPPPAPVNTNPPPKASPKQTEKKEIIYDIVDEPAEYAKGLSGLRIFIAENLKYPQRAVELGIEGKCYVQFYILEDGSITNIVVKRGVTDCPECDEEAVRMIKSMPKWLPGKLNGKAVKSLYSLPVAFKLN